MTSTHKLSFISNLKHPRLYLAFALCVILLVVNIIRGDLGVLGNDSDDLLRFLQIRDYLQGQSWFDTDQYRMGLSAAGTDMHWSRLPDTPIIVLTHFFDLFLTQEKALDMAVLFWPPLSAMILFAAFLIGAEHVDYEGNRQYLRVFVYLLAAIFVLTYFRFKSGALDHHNIQFGFVAMAMAALMDSRLRFWQYFAGGLMTALALAIGPEVYLFVAVICGYVALNWAIIGQRASAAAQGFGTALALGLCAIFIATVPASNYAIIYCDALSLITITAAGLGWLGLAAIAKFSQYFTRSDSFVFRLIALGMLGIICGVVLSFQAPQCLSNPLNSLPEHVSDLWLGYVAEAAPLYDLRGDWQILIPTTAGPLIVALIFIARRYYMRFKASERIEQLWTSEALSVMLLIMACVMTIYQIRFAPFAYIFAIFPLGRAIARSYETGLIKGGTNIKYILLMAASLPSMWLILGSPFVDENKNTKTASSTTSKNDKSENDEIDCTSSDVMMAFNDLPTGLILSGSNNTGQILIDTPHRMVSGNYHRNWQGISTQIEIYITPPDQAHILLTDNKIDYMYYCTADASKNLVNHNKDGLIAQINAGNIPDYLEPISQNELEGGAAKIFKVLPSRKS